MPAPALLRPPPPRTPPSPDPGPRPSFKNAKVGYAAIPEAIVSPPNTDEKSTPMQVAAGPAREPAGLCIDYLAVIGDALGAPPTVFGGDVTFFVSGPVHCTSPVI